MSFTISDFKHQFYALIMFDRFSCSFSVATTVLFISIYLLFDFLQINIFIDWYMYICYLKINVRTKKRKKKNTCSLNRYFFKIFPFIILLKIIKWEAKYETFKSCKNIRCRYNWYLKVRWANKGLKMSSHLSNLIDDYSCIYTRIIHTPNNNNLSSACFCISCWPYVHIRATLDEFEIFSKVIQNTL